jgi:hypothetical protein
MELGGGLDLGRDIEVGHHRKLFAPPEERAIPAVGRDLFRQPGVRNNRKSHVRKIRRLVGEYTQIIVAGRAGADPQLVDEAAPEALPAPILGDDQRPDFGKRRAERCKLGARDDRSSPIQADDEAIDSGRQLAQLARKKMTGLLIALNQLVNFPCVGSDGRPKLRHPPLRHAADLTGVA